MLRLEWNRCEDTSSEFLRRHDDVKDKSEGHSVDLSCWVCQVTIRLTIEMNQVAKFDPALQDQVTSKVRLSVALVVNPTGHQGDDANRCLSRHFIRKDGMLEVHLLGCHKINDVDTRVSCQVLRSSQDYRIAWTAECTFPFRFIEIEHHPGLEQDCAFKRIHVPFK